MDYAVSRSFTGLFRAVPAGFITSLFQEVIEDAIVGNDMVFRLVLLAPARRFAPPG